MRASVLTHKYSCSHARAIDCVRVVYAHVDTDISMLQARTYLDMVIHTYMVIHTCIRADSQASTSLHKQTPSAL